MRSFLLLAALLLAGCTGSVFVPGAQVDQDGDGLTPAQGDCDDTDAALDPSDRDADGFSSCDGDCDDADPLRTPADADGDGVSSCAETPDCDDGDPANTPGADELCDGADNDCDGVVDNGLDVTIWYRDEDGDGAADEASGLPSCDGAPAGYPLSEGPFDCDDGDDQVAPGLPELCDGLDNDCDGETDEGLELESWYPDLDGDGVPSEESPVLTCGTPPENHSLPGEAGFDCDDTDPLNFPGNSEFCDELDNNCDGVADNGVVFTDWYPDMDGDGVGAITSPTTRCAPPEPWEVETTGDCDDGEPAVHPGLPELCDDGLDNDCDGFVDDIDPDLDLDADGFTSCGADCNDLDPFVHPEQEEFCDGIDTDNDCDGQPDSLEDDDGDGFTVCEECNDGDATALPGGVEICDGANVDNDCDGIDDLNEDEDGDGSTLCEDCDDADPARRPGVPELCDGIDSDCDGSANAGGVEGSEVDDDGDGRVECDGDCDDSEPGVYGAGSAGPAAPEVCDRLDNDCDGLRPDDEVDGDGDGFVPCDSWSGAGPDTGGDCDDDQPVIYRDAPEICDELDNNCDGVVDEGFPDADGNGIIDCLETDRDGDGQLPSEGDCDNGDPTIYSGAPELCDRLDNDCDGIRPVDERDDDSDGLTPCEGDCDDSASSVNPLAPEVCDGLDSDCDGTLPADEEDGDGDGQSPCAGDCDDADPLRSAALPELCDGIDNDCDGFDDAGGAPGSETDDDGDGRVECDGDCDDAAAAVFGPASSYPAPGPAAVELCDGIDSDCNGSADVAGIGSESDDDGDGLSECAGDCDDTSAGINPSAVERCDAIDQDCDGLIDEDLECQELLCDDGLDGDGDGLTDCDDADCDVDPWCSALLCADGTLPSASGVPLVSDNTTGQVNDWFPSCAGGDRAEDFLWAWRAPTAGFWRVDTVGAGYDTTLAVLDTNCIDELGCNDDDVGSRSRVWFEAGSSEPFLLLVDGHDNQRGPYDLNIEPFTCPDVDLGADNSPVVGDTSGELDDLPSSCDRNNGGGPDLIYTWQASSSGVHTFDLTGASYDAVLTIYQGVCSMEELACDESSGPGNLPLISLSVVAGETYTLVVDGNDSARSGPFTLTITPP